jgi:hypothetical protein
MRKEGEVFILFFFARSHFLNLPDVLTPLDHDGNIPPKHGAVNRRDSPKVNVI